ncbi:MAG: type II toxin-antitoxin system PemK/MazF family toxin [Acidimicrobiales bacterium]
MRAKAQPERGDVWFADVPGDKRRPVVVLTRSSVLPRLATILVAPVTTRVRDIPTEIPLGPAQGLTPRCVANLDNILPLPKERLVQRVGRLGAPDLQRVCAAARFAIQC